MRKGRLLVRLVKEVEGKGGMKVGERFQYKGSTGNDMEPLKKPKKECHRYLELEERDLCQSIENGGIREDSYVRVSLGRIKLLEKFK